MNCPIDGTPLVMTERQGIEIDYCPKCRGIWLDRGELDKLIERSGQLQPGSYNPTPYQAQSDASGVGTNMPPMKRRLRRDDAPQYEEGYPEKRKNAVYEDDEKPSTNPINRIGDFLGDIFDNF